MDERVLCRVAGSIVDDGLKLRLWAAAQRGIAPPSIHLVRRGYGDERCVFEGWLPGLGREDIAATTSDTNGRVGKRRPISLQMEA
jgi:hypothetical protein